MSELEIQRRQEYKRNRKRWTLVQIIAIIALIAISLGTFVVYNNLDSKQYIEYTENSSIDYMVQYAENDYFEEEWIEKDQSYISSLIKGVSAEFAYDMIFGKSGKADLSYTYQIDAKMEITSKNDGYPYYTVEENILPEKSNTSNGASSVNVSEIVFIDYAKYDKLARNFVTTYNLSNFSAILKVTLSVKTKCVGQSFANNCNGIYTTTLNIPLAEDTFSIFSTQSSPANEIKNFEYVGLINRTLFFAISIVSAVLAALIILTLIVFLHLTKNDDINYAAKVRKILSSYSSFIQRIDGDFDSTGYQIVMIKTFVEMLGIRDTIQAPVLMYENKDETMTRFFIPTNTKILYTFVIKVDNYDEIYGEPDELVFDIKDEEVAEEPVILMSNVDKEELKEALATPDVVLSEIDYIEDDDDEYGVEDDEPAVEVIGVVWPEKTKQNKVYRYDPNGERLTNGDVVLVPSRDVEKNREIIRKAAVAHGNHKVDPEHIHHPLKKIIGVVKRKAEQALTPNTKD